MSRQLILLALLGASPCLATTLLYVVGEDTLGENIYINENGTVTQAWAGGLDINVGGTGDGSNGDARVVLCVQLTVSIGKGTYDTVIDFADTTPFNTANLERAAWLVDHDYPTSPVTGAALQLAIWDIMQDSGDGFNAGYVQAATGTHATDPTVLADAINYETISVGKATPLAYVYIDTTLGGAAVQDLIGQTPEPAAIVLMVSGLVLIGLSRLRRRAMR